MNSDLEKRTEMVGRVCLDLTWYPGEDLYSDGDIEDRLLQLAESTPESELDEAAAREEDWAVLYHFSRIRENIAAPLQIRRTDKVLEIGAGCGAVTGALARMAGEVTCIDLSKKRSLINARRHSDYDNIRILVGNYRDIEPNLTEKYDWITLIGVFEYAQAYIGGQDPYREFLREAAAHLKEGGKLVIAIENRLGLKYWAGCREDHTGNLFEGLEGYPANPPVRTFSRGELARLASEEGFREMRFSYPYPDYKLPMSIFSDAYLPSQGDLTMDNWNFDRDRLSLFEEKKVWPGLIADGLFGQFANSFLLELSKEELPETERTVYTRCSVERSREFAIRTEILGAADGSRRVRKSAAFPEARAHVEGMVRHEGALRALLAPFGIEVNRVLETGEGEGRVSFAYLDHTETLQDKAAALWRSGRREEAAALVGTLADAVKKAASEPFVMTEGFSRLFPGAPCPEGGMSMPVTDLDMVCENVMIGADGTRTLTDYEWTVDFPVPEDFVRYRIWHYFLSYVQEGADQTEFLVRAGLKSEYFPVYEAMEKSWQQAVAGTYTPLRELYGRISPGLRDVREEMRIADGGRSRTVNSFFTAGTDEDVLPEKKDPVCVPMSIAPDGAFTVRVPLRLLHWPRVIRWDPMDLQMLRMRVTGIRGNVSAKIEPVNGFAREGWTEFWTLDSVWKITGSFAGAESFEITGFLEVVHPASRLAEMDRARREAGELGAQLESTRGALAAQQGTRAFRGIEKMRSFRNFVKARVKTLPGFRDKTPALPMDYERWLQSHRAGEETLALQRAAVLDREPVFSILVPTYNTPETYLREMVDSVKAQTYPHWELCIADASVDSEGHQNESLRRLLRDLAEEEPRIHVRYLGRNGGISENTNEAAMIAAGDYIALLDHDDLLEPDALFEMAAAAVRTGAQVIYTDEDKVSMDGKVHFDPNLKPDYSPDLLRSHNYITHFLAVETKLFNEAGRFRQEYDGAQDYDLVLRASRRANRVEHIPKVLYHWRMHPASTAMDPTSKLYAYEAGRRAIEANLAECGLAGHAERMELWGMNHVIYETPGDPLVTILIPNMDHVTDLDRCIRSILTRSEYTNFEILVVENNSTDPQTFAYYEKIRAEDSRVRVVYWKDAFNYSAINNFGAAAAKGEYLLLLNNDTELLEGGSLREMLGICMRSDVGCVGAKLLFGDDTVQHCGIVLGFGGFAGHVFSGQGKDDYGFMMRARVTGNWSAVTAACLMIRKETFDAVGGFSEDLAVALNDVDLCLKLRAKGLLVVCTPFALWHHYESKSRGYEDTPEKKARFEREIGIFRSRWGETVDAGDPYYNPNFSVKRAPFTLW